MATTRTPQVLTPNNGITPTYAAADATGDNFVNNGKTFLYILNGGVGAVTCTVTNQIADNLGGAASTHNVAVTCPNGTIPTVIGPLDPVRFNDGNSRANVTWSGVTSVTIAVVVMQ